MHLTTEQISQMRQGVPAGTVLNRGQMARLLGIGGNTFDSWRKTMDGFPVKSGGNRGVRYEFDPHEVMNFLESEISSPKPEDNFFTSLGMDVSSDGPSGNQLKSLASARDQAIRTLEFERSLVPADRMRIVLKGIFTSLRRRCEDLPQQMARRMNLNPKTRDAMAKEMDDFLKDTAAALRDELNVEADDPRNADTASK